MLLRELLPSSAGWDVRVLATDVSTRAIAAAEAGRYGERAFVMTDPVDRQRFFWLDTDSRDFVVRDEVRDLVEFRHHNLVTDPPPFEPGEVHLVLCRNVTIYFDRGTTKRLMRNPEVLMAQILAESEQFAKRLQTVEAREAFSAFAERR